MYCFDSIWQVGVHFHTFSFSNCQYCEFELLSLCSGMCCLIINSRINVRNSNYLNELLHSLLKHPRPSLLIRKGGRGSLSCGVLATYPKLAPIKFRRWNCNMYPKKFLRVSNSALFHKDKSEMERKLRWEVREFHECTKQRNPANIVVTEKCNKIII